MNPADQDYVRELQEHASEARTLFSNAQRPERERMVARAFLRCLGAPFRDEEIVASKDEPINVVFRLARFQIKEIVGDKKRGFEWIDRQRRYAAAEKLPDLLEPYRPPRADGIARGNKIGCRQPDRQGRALRDGQLRDA